MAEPHPHVVHALIPDKYGLAVVDVAQLLSYLADGDPLEEAINNSAIDTVTDVADATARVRALNETGDANAYWDDH